MSNAPRRSDATKAAILHAAREQFAATGYERATIRAIAAAAGIDPSLVIRYYGNKEKLFAAAAVFNLDFPDLLSLPRETIGATMVASFLDRWETDDTMAALLRAAASNDIAAEKLIDILAEQVVPIIEKITPTREIAVERATLLGSQMMGLALSRYVLRFPSAVDMTREQIVAWLGPTVQRYLTAEKP